MSILSRPRHGNAVKHFETAKVRDCECNCERTDRLSSFERLGFNEHQTGGTISPVSKKALVLRNRNGQALIEFAFVSVVLTMLVLGILGLGLMLIHSTATAATSINASMLFDLKIDEENELGENPTVEDIYRKFRDGGHFNEKDLVLTAAEFFDPENEQGDAGRDRVATLNQKMFALYFYDIDRQVYRYPGTVVQMDIDGETEDTILIPIFDQATQSITGWERPVEISYDPVQDSQTANISIWMASQPSTLLVYYVDDQGNTVGGPQEAGIGTVASFPIGYNLSTTSFIPDPRFSTRVSDANRGTYGLGELELGSIGSIIPPRVVRPYRRVMEFRGTFRLIPPPEVTP